MDGYVYLYLARSISSHIADTRGILCFALAIMPRRCFSGLGHEAWLGTVAPSHWRNKLPEYHF